MSTLKEAEITSAHNEIADFVGTIYGDYKDEDLVQAVILCAAAGIRSLYGYSELEAVRHLEGVCRSWGDRIERER